VTTIALILAYYRMDGLFHGVTVERAIRTTPWPSVAVGYDGWTGGFKNTQ